MPAAVSWAQSSDAAIELLKSSAASGNRDAQYQLGHAYSQGAGVPRNGQRAAYWFQKAALQCSGPAMDELGALYLAGDGLDRNQETAAQYFRLAAAERNPAGLFDWGLALYENRAFIEDAVDDSNVAPGCAMLDMAKDRVVLTSSTGEALHASDADLLKPLGLRFMHQAADLGEPRARKMLQGLRK